MPEDRIRIAPHTVAYADRENDKLVVEFAIPGAPTDTIDVKILEDSVHLPAPKHTRCPLLALSGGRCLPGSSRQWYPLALLGWQTPILACGSPCQRTGHAVR